MKTIIKRELKNYFKNPVFWIGLIIVIAGTYQTLSPWLGIHYFKSDQEIQGRSVTTITDADIMDGYIPATLEQQKAQGIKKINQTMKKDMGLSEKEVSEITQKIKNMEMEEIVTYMEGYGYYGVEYSFEDAAYRQGTMEEVNRYIEGKMQQHPFSYYFSKKFADFVGLHMAFFATVLFAFPFLQDTRRYTYELLHTKPVGAWQYILGKIGGGFLAVLFIIGVLNVIYMVLSGIRADKSGFSVNPSDFLSATCLYILPNMLMIICVYTLIAVLFKNPLPAVPLLFLYIVYSNMGSTGPDGNYGFYGRPLAIMVRFPGGFFDTAPPPMAARNQIFLVLASAVLITISAAIWKRRRVY